MADDFVNERVVSDEWTWLADYVLGWGTWTINCEAGRECDVGMGVFAFGRPWGEQKRCKTTTTIFTVGVGAIHVRVADGKGPCKVRVDRGDVGLIGIRIDDPLKKEVA